MSRNGSYAKSMNGIVSFDDGDGTTIEGNEINTDTINCNTLNAQTDVNTSTIYTNFINSGSVGYVQCLTDVVFNGEVAASFVPTSNNQLCNKLYVDTVASSGSSILSTTNVFTGTSNTFNNSLIANDIVKSSIPNINFYNKLDTSSIVNMFSDSTNTYNGVINLCCGNGVQNPTMNIMVGNIGTFYGIKPVNIGDVYTSIKLCNSMRITLDAITAVDDTTSKDIFKFNTGVITIGKTGKLQLGNDISITQKTIESTGTTDTIDLFNNISGTIGQIRMAGKFIIKELSIATSSITDNVNLFNNLSGAFGAVNMVTNLLFKQSNILSTAASDVINLFTNLTTGTLNLATGLTTGILNIGNPTATGTGGTINIGTGPKTTISIGNLSNNSASANNGCCTINKLKLGYGTAFRGLIIRTGIGAGLSGTQIETIPGAPGFGLPIVFGVIEAGSGSLAFLYVLNIDVQSANTFRYRKRLYSTTTGLVTDTSEAISYIAIWL